MTVTSKEGHFSYVAKKFLGMACGLYLIADPEQQIEIEMIHVDVSCEDGGLISVMNNSCCACWCFRLANSLFRIRVLEQ